MAESSKSSFGGALEGGEASPAVAAVVVTYNRKSLLRQCLKALKNQTHPIEEIIVVDNLSTDGTAEMVQTEFSDVTLRMLEENRGGAGGFHEGMEMALGLGVDWIWVMDDDVEPAPTALDGLLSAKVRSRENTVALSPLKVGREGEIQFHHVGWYAPSRMQIEPLVALDEPVIEVEYSSFVGLLVRGRTVECVGLPDEGYFIWGDDVEYCQRLKKAGSMYLVQDSRVVHHDGFAGERKQAETFSKEWRNRPLHQFWRKYYSIRNSLLTLRRHTHRPWHRIRGYLTALSQLMRSMGAVLLFDQDKGLRLRLLMSAFWDGVTGRSGKRVDPEQFSTSSQ